MKRPNSEKLLRYCRLILVIAVFAYLAYLQKTPAVDKDYENSFSKGLIALSDSSFEEAADYFSHVDPDTDEYRYAVAGIYMANSCNKSCDKKTIDDSADAYIKLVPRSERNALNTVLKEFIGSDYVYFTTADIPGSDTTVYRLYTLLDKRYTDCVESARMIFSNDGDLLYEMAYINSDLKNPTVKLTDHTEDKDVVVTKRTVSDALTVYNILGYRDSSSAKFYVSSDGETTVSTSNRYYSESKHYDAEGRLLSTANTRGITVSYEYDEEGRAVRETITVRGLKASEKTVDYDRQVYRYVKYDISKMEDEPWYIFEELLSEEPGNNKRAVYTARESLDYGNSFTQTSYTQLKPGSDRYLVDRHELPQHRMISSRYKWDYVLGKDTELILPGYFEYLGDLR